MGLIVFIYIFIYFAPLIIGWVMMGIQKKIKFVHSESGLNKNGFIGYSSVSYTHLTLPTKA